MNAFPCTKSPEKPQGGPRKFIATLKPNGETQFKQALLNKLGWYVISISRDELLKKCKTQDDRKLHLNQNLRGAHEQLMKFPRLEKSSYFAKFNKWTKLTLDPTKSQKAVRRNFY